MTQEGRSMTQGSGDGAVIEELSYRSLWCWNIQTQMLQHQFSNDGSLRLSALTENNAGVPGTPMSR